MGPNNKINLLLEWASLVVICNMGNVKIETWRPHLSLGLGYFTMFRNNPKNTSGFFPLLGGSQFGEN
jgi:hypothetical protein